MRKDNSSCYINKIHNILFFNSYFIKRVIIENTIDFNLSFNYFSFQCDIGQVHSVPGCKYLGIRKLMLKAICLKKTTLNEIVP